jgi:O-antigen/teichoic acid export membrane protein
LLTTSNLPPVSVLEGPAPPATGSLRRAFSWTFVGNAIYAAGQWAILSLLAKLGGTMMLGEYALALAIAAPIAMLAHLNLRAVLATDVTRQFSMGDYLSARLVATVAGMLVMAVLVLFTVDTFAMAAVVLLVGAGLSVEAISDLCYGALQRRERMDRVAQSMILRSILSALCFGVVLWLTHNLLLSVLALVLGKAAVLLVDLRAGLAGEDLRRKGWRSSQIILRQALPLGIVLMLVSLNTNLPRYAIEHHRGSESLGLFAAVISFITIGSTMANALGQSATSRLARHYANGQFRHFRRVTLAMAGTMGLLGLAGTLAALLVGKWVLRLLYRPEFAEASPLLVAVMAISILSYVAIALGYAVTSTRTFDIQIPLFGIAAIVCGIASWLLVPRMGLQGAVVAIGIAAAVQIAGQTWILRRTLRGRRNAA